MAQAANDADGEAAFLLDVLFNHKVAWVRDLLKEKGLPSSGTKPELRERLEEHLEAQAVEPSDLVDLLDQVEGWGNQHIYLFKASDALLAVLSDQDAFRDKLRKAHLLRLLNKRVPLILPDEPTLSAIDWSEEQLRFIWVEKRTYRESREDESYEDDGIEYHAYEVKHSRGLISFSSDLVSGLSELMIQRLPSGNNYLNEKDKYIKELSAVFDTTQLTLQKISRAIRKIDQASGIRKRSSQMATALGYQVTYTSRSRNDDVYNDPSIKKARKALGTGVVGRLGNYYWPIHDHHIHVKLYAKDHRIGIFGECSEAEVKDVLSEIRGYC